MSIEYFGGLLVLLMVFNMIMGLRNGVKLEEIHESTNGNLSKVTAQLDIALERIDKLESLLRDKA